MKYKKNICHSKCHGRCFLFVILVMKQMQMHVMILCAIFKHLFVLVARADLAVGRDQIGRASCRERVSLCV